MLAWYFQCISSHLNVSLVGGSSIHKWFEIAVSYCSGRLVWKELLFVGCVVMQTRQGWIMQLMLWWFLWLKKRATVCLFSFFFVSFFFFLSGAGRLTGVFPLLFRRGGKLKGTTNIEGSQRRQCVMARNWTSAYTLGFTCRIWKAETF